MIKLTSDNIKQMVSLTNLRKILFLSRIWKIFTWLFDLDYKSGHKWPKNQEYASLIKYKYDIRKGKQVI